MSKLLQKAEAKFRRGKNRSAKDILRKILIKKPNHAEALSLIGAILLVEENYQKAVKFLGKAIKSDKVQPCWYANYANALQKTGAYDAAEKAYKIAELTGCNSKAFLTGYGRFLTSVIQDHNKAELCFAKILEQDPDYYSAYIDLGNVYNNTGEFDKSIQVLEECLKLNIKDPVIYSNLGMALSQQGRSEECLTYFEKALELSPNFGIASNNYVLNMMNVYDDQEYIYKQVTRLAEKLNANAVTEFIGDIDTDKERKVKLGFVSADFYNHAVANFIAPILASIEKETFSVYLYYNNSIQDKLTSAFYNIADKWFNCLNVSTKEFEKQIREDKIDILIDLSNHSKGNRLDVFTRKPAPIQVSLMGLPVSTGLKSMDYSFATDYIIKQCKLDKNASEKPWPLPWQHWYMQIGTPPAITPPPFQENGYITFGSFNGLRKMNSGIIEAWSKILLNVPKSKLRIVIHDENNINMQNYVYSLFEQHDIERSRIVLIGRMDLQKYMASHNEVDIALDTYPYNGYTTTYYTLTMGTPLISCRGNAIPGNEAYLILSLLGLEEWVGDNLDEYVSLATKLASNTEEILSIKASLREQFLNSKILKHRQLTSEFEKAWRGMWRIYCDNHRK